MKAIGYCRVSTTKQDIIRQTAKIKEHCLSNSIELLRIIEDFGQSGADGSRKGYKELLQLTSNDCDLIVISELSRLSRQEYVTETIYNIQNIINHGIAVVLLDNPSKVYEANTALKIDELLILTIQAYGAAQERLEIKRKNQDGKQAIFNSNPYAVVDGFIPYGYRKVLNPNGNRPKYILEEVPEQVTNIKKLFELVLNGFTLYQAASYFVERNILFAKGHASVSSLSKLLHSDIYRGIRRRVQVYGKDNPVIYEQRIKPIIEERDFLRASELIKINYTRYSPNGTTFNPLKGIFRCRCGRAMTVKDKRSEKEKNKIIYRCNPNFTINHPDACAYSGDVHYDFTNKVISGLFKQRTIEIRNYYENSADFRIEGLREIIEGAERKISTLEAERLTIKEQINETIEKVLSVSNLTLISKLEEQQNKLDVKLMSNSKAIEEANKVITQKHAEIKAIEKLNSSELWQKIESITLEELSSIFRDCLEKVEYIPFNNMKGTFRVIFIGDNLPEGKEFLIVVNKVRNHQKAYLLPEGWYVDYEAGEIVQQAYKEGTDYDHEEKRLSFREFFKEQRQQYEGFFEINL